MKETKLSESQKQIIRRLLRKLDLPEPVDLENDLAIGDPRVYINNLHKRANWVLH